MIINSICVIKKWTVVQHNIYYIITLYNVIYIVYIFGCLAKRIQPEQIYLL